MNGGGKTTPICGAEFKKKRRDSNSSTCSSTSSNSSDTSSSSSSTSSTCSLSTQDSICREYHLNTPPLALQKSYTL
ncbi:hypothetical protein O3M35_003579 [Rhynocoris fuscipes]|uniref:Uncharacterized protein n=1 Tax=Rhynocoris fuscipes TaxID=488301 RepID=A0AAW1CKM2_9HEMI